MRRYRCTKRLAGLAIAASMAIGLPAVAQDILTAPLESETVQVAVDSGLVRNDGTETSVIWSSTIDVPGATWLRLSYDQAQLSGDPADGSGSYLMITSTLDGAYQYQNRIHVGQWGHTSAYLNGGSVEIELVAAPGTGDNRVVITRVEAGLPIGAGRSICGSVDDRVLSDDPRACRALPIGCTAWLFDDPNHTFLTAGHCTSSLTVMEFNVPLSNSNGSLNHPPPEDQYAVDSTSVQTNGGQGVGNDYAYFGCFQNSNTGLWPHEAQGDWYETMNPPQVNGQEIRITGYGTTSSPVDPRWNQVQKTHIGPYFSFSGTTVSYTTDTTGGNSGSPVIFQDEINSIGIHTHGGCNSSGGNFGTGFNHPGLQDFLANPRGVCIPRGLEFSFPDGLPDMILPAGGSSFRVEVLANSGVDPEPGSGLLWVDDGMGFVSYPMTQLSQNVYDAVFPATTCGTTVEYYVSAEDTDGGLHASPSNAPIRSYDVLSANGITTVVNYDFETTPPWSVINDPSLSTGEWEIGVPGNFGRSDPPSDADGSGRCWVTDNVSQADVDGGPTRLLTQEFDLSGMTGPKLSYARWHQTNDSASDQLVVEVSDDGGVTWALLEQVGNTSSWTTVTWDLADYIDLTSLVVVRFSVSDNPNDSVTESGIDAFAILETICDPCDPDINGDGSLDSKDFVLFLNLFTAGDPGADYNADGVVNSQDFTAYLNDFVAGC
jgi:V8-like Glu-specific endopeptidase